MKTLLALCAVSTTAFAFAGSPLDAQAFRRETGLPPSSVGVAERRAGTISGRAVDSATSRPIGSVQVALVGTRFRATTRDDGIYTIAGVPAGDFTISATFIGRAP